MARPSALVVALVAACLASAASFAPVQRGGACGRDGVSLSAEREAADGGKQFAAAAVASAYLLGGLAFGADAALADASYPTSTAADFSGGTSTILLAGRSGGRAGGRAGGASRSAYSHSSSSRVIQKTTVVRPQTTVVAPPPVVVAPPVGYGYGYNPYPGLGLGLGINAIGAVGEGIREARQESEIANSRAQVQAMKEREAMMEQRIQQMEMQQQQNMQQQQMQQQQMMMSR